MKALTARPWTRTISSLPAVDHSAAPRGPLGRRLVATATALLGRRTRVPAGRAAAASAFEFPAAFGASDAELVRLSRRPFGWSTEDIRLVASRAVTTGIVRPR